MDANIPSPSPKENQVSTSDVMGAMKKQQSGNAETMSLQDIIKHDCETNGCPVSWQQIYAGLSEAVKSPKYRLMRANNSIMAFSIPEKGMANAHLITADDPRTLVDSMKQFHQAMLKSGYKQVRSKITNLQVVRVLEMAGIKVKQTMGQHIQDGQASPAIDIVMEA